MERAQGWNERLVSSLFNDQEANLVKKIPLYLAEGDDKLIWRSNRDGNYSVRSAYNGIMKDIIDSQHLRKSVDWMLIWKLKIPNKVKLLLWRVVRGCLPTQMNL